MKSNILFCFNLVITIIGFSYKCKFTVKWKQNIKVTFKVVINYNSGNALLETHISDYQFKLLPMLFEEVKKI